MAMGVFQGHMIRMADGFKAIREAELVLAGEFNPQQHDEFFTYFDWQQFSEEEWRLCPPVVSIGGDGAMYDIGFQNLSRVLMTKMPIKVLVLDTQVYSNTGGQACTSGFTGQVSDMAGFGKVWKGKAEIRKELGLIGMAHRNAYVMQGSTANITHLLEGYIEGLNSRRPALFNVYTPCQPEHGIADDAAQTQSKLAVESRAYPLFRFNPDAGITFEECCDLDGNPAMDDDWPSYKLSYLDDQGHEQQLDLPVTFADFAVTEGRFRKHFRQAPHDAWNDNMVPLHEFLEQQEDEREGRFPYIWGVDKKNQLIRVMVTAELVQSSEDRRNYWRLLKSLAGLDKDVDIDEIIKQTQTEMAQKLAANFLAMASGASGNVLNNLITDNNTADTAAPAADMPAATPAGVGQSVWIDTPECSTCDECVTINPKIFAYNEQKKAVVIDPQGGSYKDIVRAAEKCTSGCIHPGAPFNANEKDLDKLIKRAEKYQ